MAAAPHPPRPQAPRTVLELVGGMKAAALLSHQLLHQIGAGVRETTALLGRERLAAIECHQRVIGLQHRVVQQAEACGAIERLPAAGGGYADQGSFGGQLQHRVVIGRTQLGQRIRSDTQAGPKRGLQVVATAGLPGASMGPASVQGFRLRAVAGRGDPQQLPGPGAGGPFRQLRAG